MVSFYLMRLKCGIVGEEYTSKPWWSRGLLSSGTINSLFACNILDLQACTQ